MLYRLQVEYPELTDSGRRRRKTIELYLEGGAESPSGYSFVNMMDGIKELAPNPAPWAKAIAVIKNLGSGEHGWEEYFPYLHHPDILSPCTCTQTSSHPDYPGFKCKVTLTYIRVFKPYGKMLFELGESLRYVKGEDREQLVKILSRNDLS